MLVDIIVAAFRQQHPIIDPLLLITSQRRLSKVDFFLNPLQNHFDCRLSELQSGFWPWNPRYAQPPILEGVKIAIELLELLSPRGEDPTLFN
jgi:hypothetical protein